MFARTVVRAGPLAATITVAALLGPVPQSACQERQEQLLHEAQDSIKKNSNGASRLLRKQTILFQATSNGDVPKRGTRPRRINTRQQLAKIREKETEMLLRWERDEDGWRELPARAWPAYQPDPEQLKELQAEASRQGCQLQKENMDGTTVIGARSTGMCQDIMFNIATALVAYGIDAAAGLRQYKALAKEGHVDAMVACGVILVEGRGVPPQEQLGIEWLRKAVACNSVQGCYELGAILYTGIDEVVEDDPKAAFDLFRRAADQGHIAGLFMMADCLIEGEGTRIDVGRAVPLLYKAAEGGHRFSRQTIRQLLAKQEYKEEKANL